MTPRGDTIRRITELTQPAVEPITLAEVKLHLRITDTSQDTWLTAAITAARKAAEEYTGLWFVSRTGRQTSDHYPEQRNDYWWSGVRQLPAYAAFGSWWIALMIRPISAVTAFNVYNDADVATLVDPATYFVSIPDPFQNGRVALRRSMTWPIALRTVDAIQIDFTAGFGAAAVNVPGDIRQALLVLVAYMYANRGDCTCDCAGATRCMYPCGVTLLLDSYRLLEV